jgi:hypothetical protein
MKQAKELLERMADKLEDRVEQLEVKNALHAGVKNLYKKAEGNDGKGPAPYLQKTNLVNLFQGKLQQTLGPNKLPQDLLAQ